MPRRVLAVITAANAKAAVTGERTRCRGAGAVLRPAGLAGRRRCPTSRPAGHRARVDAAPPRRPGRVPRWGGRSGGRPARCPPRCARPARRPASTPAGCSRWPPWSGCSSRRRASTSCRCWPIRPTRARSAWWTRPRRRSSRASRCARSSIRRTGSWSTARRTPRRFAGPAFLLNQMLVWGFTGQVISAMLDVAGWAQPWNTDDVRELDDGNGARRTTTATTG